MLKKLASGIATAVLAAVIVASAFFLGALVSFFAYIGSC